MKATSMLAFALLAVTATAATPAQVADPAIKKAAARVSALEKKLAELQTSKKASRRGGHVGRITPELDPVSDKKFFDGKRADYPTDARPNVKDHFTFPFPIVQDSHDYDKDYVKDENSDNGAWAAQARYDKIRAQIAAAKEAAEKAKAKEYEEQTEEEKAAAAEKKAAEERARQEKLAEAARKAEEDAQKRADSANKTIADAEKLVKSEVTDLEDCMKQLKEAKVHLEKLMKDKEAAMEAQAKLDEAKANAEAAEADAEKEEVKATGRLAESGESKLSLDEQITRKEKQIASTETDLDAAAKNLRKFRSADSGKGQNGGVYERSAGLRMSPPRILAAALLGLVCIWSTA